MLAPLRVNVPGPLIVSPPAPLRAPLRVRLLLLATVMIGSPAAIVMSGFTVWLPESTWICEFAAIEDCSVIVSDPAAAVIVNEFPFPVEQHRTERYGLVQRDVEGGGEIEPVFTWSSNQALAVGPLGTADAVVPPSFQLPTMLQLNHRSCPSNRVGWTGRPDWRSQLLGGGRPRLPKSTVP